MSDIGFSARRFAADASAAGPSAAPVSTDRYMLLPLIGAFAEGT